MSKADKTKELIIERTAEIFNTKGFSGTSLNDMTSVTGLTKGSIYGNFKNKDEVAMEAFKFNLQIMNHLFSAEMAKKTSFRDKLLVYTDVLSNFSERKFPRGGCPILNTAVESDDTHPLLKQRAQKALLAWKDKIADILENGMETGEFKSGLNTEQVAISILASLEGAIMIRKLTDNQKYIQFAMKSLQDYIHQL
ncbi:TetR/AcrR family transcriptional regulator [uncultured Bacteroides sp.]|uniref:TetR/AcrR family transcriptional regulator n=1 Tax=uncultured Bacteroides sp. TaxID=162156 RepID=UPI002AA8531B|nr:TetR/AcrR family transcriptional regulator [uncultured Bacteroides sp.]